MQNIFCSTLLRAVDFQVVIPVRYLRKAKWSVVKKKPYPAFNIADDSDDLYSENIIHKSKQDDSQKMLRKSVTLLQEELLAKIQPDLGGEWCSKLSKMNPELPKEIQNYHSQCPQLKRIIYDGDDEAIIRVKCSEDKELIEEWVDSCNEIKLLKISRDTKRLETATKQVIVEMEKLKTSINLEDLDEAIERAMSITVDYNFSIDKSGNVSRERNNNFNGPTV